MNLSNKFGYLLVLVTIALIPMAGCSNNQIAVTAGVGEVFTIGINQSAQITGEDMTIKFDEVIGDSRCPQNVTCVWQGVASSRITINYQGTDYSIVLNMPGLTDKAEEIFAHYTLTYNLNPYPREGEQISLKEYRLTLTVTTKANDYSSLVNDLKKEGYSVQEDGEVNQPFFSVDGKIIKVIEEDVQVFEYKDEPAMQTDASQVSTMGSYIGTAIVEWISTPHFYKSGRVIVLYVGNNVAVTGALTTVLGTQFAGQ